MLCCTAIHGAYFMKEKIICHLIAGFLGAGKSTFIKQLLAYKPKHEKWAVLVNEAGNTHYPNSEYASENVFIKELYGGCLCCTAGVSFRVALNSLIKEVAPQRIFIEPAGAGHLAKIQTLLEDQFYKPVLNLKTSICLLSTQQLADNRYTENEGYLSLIKQADKLCIAKEGATTQVKEIAERFGKPLYQLQNNQDDLTFIEKA
jgi:G3E family GTPase